MSALPKLSSAPSTAAASRARQAAVPRRNRSASIRAAALAPRTIVSGHLKVEPGTAWLPNPYQPIGETPRLIETPINRRVDILQAEYSSGRLTKGAFQVGRNLQAVFEASHMGGGSSWSDGDRVDATKAKEAMIQRKVDLAREVRDEMEFITRQVGMIGARFLRAILEGETFAEYAARRGRTGDRAVAYVADRFRSHLEDLAEVKLKRGVVR